MCIVDKCLQIINDLETQAIELNKHKVSNNEVACCSNCHLPLDNIEYIKKKQIADKKYNK